MNVREILTFPPRRKWAGYRPELIVIFPFFFSFFFNPALNRKLYCRGQSRKKGRRERQKLPQNDNWLCKMDTRRYNLVRIHLCVELSRDCHVWVWKCVFNAILCPQEHCANERPSVSVTASTTVSIVVIVDCQCAAGLVGLYLCRREWGGRQSNIRVFCFWHCFVIRNTQTRDYYSIHFCSMQL